MAKSFEDAKRERRAETLEALVEFNPPLRRAVGLIEDALRMFG